MEDLAKRKAKIKGFLTMKQEAGLANIKHTQELHASRLRKSEEKAQEKLEEIKRKELKKIARIREEERLMGHQCFPFLQTKKSS